ncbi:hypothetical protein A3J20_01545 [Candidatus Gottesmanbacteria bacterium RIFCSPLOWO2_02_FULL_42_29]|uniref:Pyruvate carboxyltransferase domain-containing protein n=2 Tax=Candidatus Gottesmaniibacteriota TaxID=1752720 RepID=A0A1F6BEV6_9BACT|nr:MAG: Homocitrate synthase [Candidatus Gottesmanbacteria bacterium GW2011_GWA2_42_18]OGG12079.1 MAG: hypothetical protein A2781_03355 [Candidatus Gottesmanbacteria bacterium RIFCSPHIGHO2_01_FULL_42_27]OGG35078.1 MAG: hypothetical protein A3G68_01380 [Candidatus Gottesmanbacteria bacterium RIFCSPLOWO2_12_FULL_42_10]OGG35464.1 MAG: hypothetical protein A2968_00710 [Candidatus Gottesmanbacteria bacterium RIFCSPLOWO2_01_FULL_42_22]OGG38768.1 MAG: hypothetical protein A3J20_01545 [Candidatus Gotte
MNNLNSFLKNYKGIIDTSLREGLQYRFSSLSLPQQILILKLLSKIGVDRIEVGNPVVDEIRKTVTKLVQIPQRPPIISHVRNRLEDLTLAIESGIDGVNILCTVDPVRLKAMRLNMSQYLENLKANILKAKEKKLEIRVSVEDFFQADANEAIKVYELSESMKVDRIGIADTLGVAMSWDIENKISNLRKFIKTDIEVHFHNDLGQANSNAISAIKSGANWVDTTLLGIGERSGITALSTFLAALYIFDPKISKRYNLQYVTEAENTLAGMIGKEVPFNLLTNRENGFAHKAGIHLHALVNFGPTTYEPISPGVFGNVRQLVYGSEISGRTDEKTVKDFYKKYGKS